MTNKQLFKEAIAEAKSIREAAIINAKEALEETLTPQIKNLLAQRLAEMEEEEMEKEDDLSETGLNTVTENEKEEEEEEAAAEEEENSEEEAAGESEEEDIDVANMSVEDLKDLIRDLVGQMVDLDGDGDHDMEDHAKEQPAGEEAPEDLVGMDMDAEEEEIDLDELLRELSEGDDIEAFHDKVEAEFHAQGLTGDQLQAALDMLAKEGANVIDDYGMDPIAAANAIMDKVAPVDGLDENVDPQTLEMIIAGIGALGTIGLGFAIDPLKKLLGRTKAGKSIVQGLEGAAKGASGAIKGGQSKGTYESKQELSEALKTIKTLKGQLQEVNLLNAKLLYVNKIFKASRNLSEAQKVNIIATFDKATTAKEAQLVYESLKTTLQVNKPAPTKITESKLGMASRPVGTAPKKPEIITEVSSAVKRMQQLAGIIKN